MTTLFAPDTTGTTHISIPSHVMRIILEGFHNPDVSGSCYAECCADLRYGGLWDSKAIYDEDTHTVWTIERHMAHGRTSWSFHINDLDTV